MLGHVIEVLKAAGVGDVLVVVGGDREAVEAIAAAGEARTAFNPGYAGDEMLGSLQLGLRAMSAHTEAALITLGDQPYIREETVRSILDEYHESSAALIVPSYHMRRGHPWLIARQLWQSVLGLSSSQTPRDFLNQQSNAIHYLKVDTPTILQDLDTPADYAGATRPD